MNKKFISIILSVSILFTFGLQPVFAFSGDNSNSATIQTNINFNSNNSEKFIPNDIYNGEQYHTNGIVTITIAAVKIALSKAGLKLIPTLHFVHRLADRNISIVQAVNTLLKGTQYHDTLYKSTVYYYKGIALVVEAGKLITVYTGPVKSRWILK